MKYKEIIWLHGKPVKRSKNLRGFLEYARKHPVKLIAIRRLTQGEGYLYVRFENEANYITTFADFRVLKQWISERRNLRGARLVIDGLEVGPVSAKNGAL